MRVLMVLSMFLFYGAASAQDSPITDNLLDKLCKSINENKSTDDSVRLSDAFEKHLFPIFKKMEPGQVEESWQRVFYRLQRSCAAFKAILDRINPLPSGDWKQVDLKPAPTSNKQDCKDFAGYKKMSYLESTGDTVHVTISNGIWTDHFVDGTTSTLKFKWITDCEFQIEFIESNNEVRKNYSRPGDKYAYQVLGKTPDYFDMSAESVGTNKYMTFRLYY
jgi:hypothetical protein